MDIITYIFSSDNAVFQSKNGAWTFALLQVHAPFRICFVKLLFAAPESVIPKTARGSFSGKRLRLLRKVLFNGRQTRAKPRKFAHSLQECPQPWSPQTPS